MRNLAAIVLTVGLLVLGTATRSSSDSIDDAFDKLENSMDDAMSEVDAQWESMVAAEEARWNALKAEVEAKWDSYVGSTKKEFVDYSDDKEARSVVDYDKGEVVVEVLIPAEDVKIPSPGEKEPGEEPVKATLPEKAVEKIEAQVEKIAQPKFEKSPNEFITPIEDQVKTAEGEPVTKENAKEFVKNEIAPKAVIEPKIIKGKDGVKRVKARVVIPMVPEHLYIRAAKYKDVVVEEAAKYDMEPQLLMAVIQTESYFNPRARSPAMAFGLMQLIPKYGAFEATEYIEGKGRLVTPDYLYVPENNVRLGAAYLHLLDTRYYGQIEDPEKREVLVVASYNWGPTAVKRKIVDKVEVEKISQDDLKKEVDNRTPEETRNYVVRVTSRKSLYDGLFAQAQGSGK